jgi:hypothetical protein
MVSGRKSRDDKGVYTGRTEAGRRQVGDRSETGRRQVGDRSEKFHLKEHLKGMQNPEFRSVDLRILEFRSYLYERIIKISFQLLSYFFVLQIYK